MHGGNSEPNFIARAVSYHRTALKRQAGESVRIRRRGGEGCLLESKGEFNRSRIPRLVVEPVDEERYKQMEVDKAKQEASKL